jgi:cold shock CspA family protein
MSTGVLKTWNDDAGYGFIKADAVGQPDQFAHAKYFAFGVKPERGLRVEFEIVNDERTGRDRADKIRVLS